MKITKWLILLVVLSLFVFGCTFSQPKKGIVLNFSLRGPGTLSGFKCFGVNVVGEGIPSTSTAIPADWQSVAAGRTCTYPGLTSAASAPGSDGAVSFPIKVFPGKSRVFQVIGVETTGACPTETIGTLLEQAQNGKLAAEIGGLYEVGRTVADVYRAETVRITSNYVASSAFNLKDCYSSGGSSGPLAISPANVTMAGGDYYYFKPTGGVPPYKFRTVEEPSSFGQIDLDTGLYICGDTSYGDSVVEITDFAQNKVYATVRLADPGNLGGGAGLSYWYRASQYLLTQADNTPVTSTLNNAGSVGTVNLVPPSPPEGKKGSRFRTSSGPNKFPSIEIYAGYNLSKVSANTILSGDFRVYMVVRRSKAVPATAMCMGFDCGLGEGFRLFWPTSYSPFTFYFKGSGTPVNTTRAAADETKWILVSGEWDGTISPTALRLFAKDDKVYGANTDNSTFSVSNPVFNIGSVDGQDDVDYLEFAEMLIYDLAGLPGNVEPYLQAKYGL